MTEKPHKGKIAEWYKDRHPDWDAHKGKDGYPDDIYIICGRFVDHPDFAGEYGHTSWVVSHNEKTGEIETRNSRYTLVGEEMEGMD